MPLTSSQTLRADLMAPEPIKRVYALHELERQLDGGPPADLAQELEAFAARGIPYYAPDDPQYCEWVGRAVAYWERLCEAPPSCPLPGQPRQ